MSSPPPRRGRLCREFRLSAVRLDTLPATVQEGFSPMMTDPIADMLTRIRNAVRIERTFLDMPTSKMRRGIAQVLKDEGYVWDFEEIETVARTDASPAHEIWPQRRAADHQDRPDQQAGPAGLPRIQGAQADSGRHGHPDPEHASRHRQRSPRSREKIGGEVLAMIY